MTRPLFTGIVTLLIFLLAGLCGCNDLSFTATNGKSTADVTSDTEVEVTIEVKPLPGMDSGEVAYVDCLELLCPRNDLIVLAELSLDGHSVDPVATFVLDQPTALAIPSNAIPSNALPSNAIPSNALPSNAIPSNALPSSLFNSSDPALKFLSIDPEVSSYLTVVAHLTIDGRDDLNMACAIDSASLGMTTISATCPIRGQYRDYHLEAWLLLGPPDAIAYSTLDDILLYLLSQETRLPPEANLPPELDSSVDPSYNMVAGSTLKIPLTANAEKRPVWVELEQTPDFLTRDSYRLVLSPRADQTGTFKINGTIGDFGSPPVSNDFSITVEVTATDRGNPSSGVLQSYPSKSELPEDEVASLLTLANHTLWVFRRGPTAMTIADGNPTLVDPGALPSYTRFFDGLAEKDGRFWLVTDSGVFRGKPSDWTTITLEPVEDPPLDPWEVRVLVQTSDGAIWAGMRQSGLIRWPASGSIALYSSNYDGTVKRVLESNTYYSIAPNPNDGTLWLGSDNGLYQWSPSELRVVRSLKDVVAFTPKSTFNSTIVVNDGRVVFGSDKGLFRVDPEQASLTPITLSQAPTGSVDQIIAMFRDSSERIYVVGYDGLFVSTDNAATFVRPETLNQTIGLPSPRQAFLNQTSNIHFAETDAGVYIATPNGVFLIDPAGLR